MSNATGWVIALVLAAVGGRKAQAAVLIDLYHTGVDGAHAVLPDQTTPDPHYTLTSVPGGSSTTLVRTSAGGYPVAPYYLGDDALSAWIGPHNDHQRNSPPGDYTFRTTFDLTGFNPSTARLDVVIVDL